MSADSHSAHNNNGEKFEYKTKSPIYKNATTLEYVHFENTSRFDTSNGLK